MPHGNSKLFPMKAIQHAIVFVLLATPGFAQDAARMDDHAGRRSPDGVAHRSADASDLRRVGDVVLFRIVEATLEFQKDASGGVTAVRLRQGRINELGPRK